MTEKQMNILKDFAEMLTGQVEKINKKNDITPDELMRMDKVTDILKDIQVICAMEEYGSDPEEEMYSSTGYYGRNSRDTMYAPSHYSRNEGYSARGRYSSRGYSRDEAAYKMRNELEEKLANAKDEREREMIMKCMRALDN